jgi:pilus assembly protein Flp/PilA
MKKIANVFRGFMQEEEGAALVEYGMLLLLIALLCIVALRLLGSKTNNAFQNIQANLP